jgi:hypothetical protein
MYDNQNENTRMRGATNWCDELNEMKMDGIMNQKREVAFCEDKLKGAV